MPSRPTHRLDAHLVPPQRDSSAVDEAVRLFQQWAERGFVDGNRPGPAAETLVPGGFASVRIDDPRGLVLYANQVGGFRVRCPSCARSLAREFRWREPTVCPGCGGAFTVDELETAPRVAVGRASVVLIDVASADVREIPVGWTLVLRRPR